LKRSIMLRSILIFLAFFCSCRQAYAQNLIKTSFNTEDDILHRSIDDQQQSGYTYNSIEIERELLFKQLEIITGDEETRYIIVPGDTLTVSYDDRTKRVGATYKVSSDGMINLPLVGAIKVAGLNRMNARQVIEDMLHEYIRHPEVGISINTAGRYMVLGQVTSPGVYLLQPNLTIMEAILEADGYDEDNSNLKSVLVMRGGLEKPIVQRLDLKKMIKTGDRSDNILVKPGDMIYVPRTFIANIDKFTDKIYRYVSSYYGLGRLPGPPIRDDKEIILYDR